MAAAQWDAAALQIHHERCAPLVSIFPLATTGGQRERHNDLNVDEDYGRSGWHAG